MAWGISIWTIYSATKQCNVGAVLPDSFKNLLPHPSPQSSQLSSSSFLRSVQESFLSPTAPLSRPWSRPRPALRGGPLGSQPVWQLFGSGAVSLFNPPSGIDDDELHNDDDDDDHESGIVNCGDDDDGDFTSKRFPLPNDSLPPL